MGVHKVTGQYHWGSNTASLFAQSSNGSATEIIAAPGAGFQLVINSVTIYSDTAGQVTLAQAGTQIGARLAGPAGSTLHIDGLDNNVEYHLPENEGLDYTSNFAATIDYDIVINYAIKPTA